MINFIIWIVVGAIIGWVASQLMGRPEGLLMNIVVGIVGAFLAGLVVSGGTINNGNFSVLSLIVSLIGACVLLAIVGFFQRRSARR